MFLHSNDAPSYFRIQFYCMRLPRKSQYCCFGLVIWCLSGGSAMISSLVSHRACPGVVGLVYNKVSSCHVTLGQL